AKKFWVGLFVLSACMKLINLGFKLFTEESSSVREPTMQEKLAVQKQEMDAFAASMPKAPTIRSYEDITGSTPRTSYTAPAASSPSYAQQQQQALWEAQQRAA